MWVLDIVCIIFLLAVADYMGKVAKKLEEISRYLKDLHKNTSDRDNND